MDHRRNSFDLTMENSYLVIVVVLIWHPSSFSVAHALLMVVELALLEI